jgi:hypothetical protein
LWSIGCCVVLGWPGVGEGWRLHVRVQWSLRLEGQVVALGGSARRCAHLFCGRVVVCVLSFGIVFVLGWGIRGGLRVVFSVYGERRTMVFTPVVVITRYL